MWIGPPWETPRVGLVAVVIDPGRAFGTGAHPTTRLCLELLQELPLARRGETVTTGGARSLLDIGCGSGVLAIAAAKLGFEPVIGIDNDRVAIEAAAANADANGVTVDLRLADALAGAGAGTESLPAAAVGVCNISLQTLETLAPRLECEALIASGFLSQEHPVLAGFELVEQRVQGEWGACLAARRSRG